MAILAEPDNIKTLKYQRACSNTYSITLNINWFKSYLTGRSQCIKIGSALSSSVKLSSGVPWGGGHLVSYGVHYLCG